MRRLVLLAVLASACSSAVSSPAPPPAAASTSGPSSAGCDGAEARQLDFWIGDWDVIVRTRKAEGSDEWLEQRGENHVRATLGRCAVEESFRAEGPGQPWSGHSVSAYDRQAGAWRQTWVDDSGSYLAFTGGPRRRASCSTASHGG